MFRANRWEAIFNSDRRGIALAATIGLSTIAALIVGLFVALLSGPIALGIVLALLVLAQILRQIEVGFAALAAVICLLPFGALPINIGFKPTFLDLIIVALYGVWMLERATGKLGRFISTPLTIPVETVPSRPFGFPTANLRMRSSIRCQLSGGYTAIQLSNPRLT